MKAADRRQTAKHYLVHSLHMLCCCCDTRRWKAETQGGLRCYRGKNHPACFIVLCRRAAETSKGVGWLGVRTIAPARREISSGPSQTGVSGRTPLSFLISAANTGRKFGILSASTNTKTTQPTHRFPEEEEYEGSVADLRCSEAYDSGSSKGRY